MSGTVSAGIIGEDLLGAVVHGLAATTEETERWH